MSLLKTATMGAIFLVCSTALVAAADSCGGTITNWRGRPISVKSREVLGIVLGKATAKQIVNLLGPVKMTRAVDPGVEKGCYVSEVGDHTVLELYYWQDPIGFSISRDIAQTYRTCRPSKLVRSTLATANGLRLGLTPEQVTAILGEPNSIHGDEFVYWHNFQRLLTAKEIAASKRAGGIVGPINIHDRVEIRFSNSRVVLIDVEHNELI